LPGLLIFDLDGTLVDSRDDIAISVNLTLEELDCPKKTPQEIYGYIGGGIHNLIRNSLPAGRAEGLLEKGVDTFWAIYKEHVLDTTRLFPGVCQMLETLYRKKMAVATNKPYAHAHMILEGLGVARYFTNVQGWKMGLPVKPDPAIVLRAIEEAEAPKEDAVMIGDGLNDILAARAAGIKCCAVGYGYGSRERLMEAGPDYFAEAVSDIIELFN
jgi:phosphoglycolate phosphatase